MLRNFADRLLARFKGEKCAKFFILIITSNSFLFREILLHFLFYFEQFREGGYDISPKFREIIFKFRERIKYVFLRNFVSNLASIGSTEITVYPQHN
jgi:hypothetical protein